MGSIYLRALHRLGLTTLSELEKSTHLAERKAKLDISDKLKAFHDNYDEQQKALESAFSYKDIERISVNFWDDFCDDGDVEEGKIVETYAYIEDPDLPNVECYKLLSRLVDHIEKKRLLPPSVKMRMHFSDSSAKYPHLINEHAYMLRKAWEIRITHITHRLLDELIQNLKNYSDVVPFNIYSES